jgi:hypothetical protein
LCCLFIFDLWILITPFGIFKHFLAFDLNKTSSTISSLFLSNLQCFSGKDSGVNSFGRLLYSFSNFRASPSRFCCNFPFLF